MRVVTRADFDGLVCGALISLIEEIDSYFFAEPKFMQDGEVKIHREDIIANLPYHPNCSLWFDHHITNRAPGFSNDSIVPGKGAFRLAPSAARVVHDYYNSVDTIKNRDGLNALNSDRIKYLLHEADKIDAALLTPLEVLHPSGYVLISMTIDGKRPQDKAYWLNLIDLFRDATLEETVQEQEVQLRCQQILEAQDRLKEILMKTTILRDNVIFTDLRGIKDIPDGNRFLVFTLFPTSNISLKIAEDSQRANATAISVGYNIFNTTSKVNVGALMEKHGGGGHHVVGSCRVPKREAEKHIREIFEAIRE